MSLLRFQDPDVSTGRRVCVESPAEPVVSDVERLRAVVGYPLVSIFLATSDGEHLTTGDMMRLSSMLSDVERRLRLELGVHDVVQLADRCRSAVIDLLDEPQGCGLALFVGAGHAEAFRLPHLPVERVVIDPTFATREIEFALQRSPRCRIVVIGTDETRMYVAERGTCIERPTAWFPVRRAVREGAPRDTALRDHVGDVVSGIRLDVPAAGLPLIVVGPRMVANEVSNAPGVEAIAVVDHPGMDLSADAVLDLARSVMCSVAARSCESAFDRIDQAVAEGSAAIGLADVWEAAVQGEIALVVVDREFSQGAVVDPEDGSARWVDDPSVPGVIDDIVDELVELTMLAGGEVVFVDGGELGDDRVVGVRRGPGQPADVERFRISA